jgi:hypothetical protein
MSKSGPGSYRHGRIIYAYLTNQKGKRELHPAIILDANEDILQPEAFDPRRDPGSENSVHVIGVSTKHKHYHALQRVPYVQLPFTTSGHPVTGLNKDCGAIIGWYHRIAIPDDVVGFGGDIPDVVMGAIDREVRADLERKVGKALANLRQIFDLL